MVYNFFVKELYLIAPFSITIQHKHNTQWWKDFSFLIQKQAAQSTPL